MERTRRLTTRLAKLSSQISAEFVRISIFRLILAPATYLLPERVAMGVAQLLAYVLLLLPTVGPPEYHQLRAAFGRSRWETIKLARRRLGWTFRRFVQCKRVLLGRVRSDRWRIFEKNAKLVDDIRCSGRSYILVSGHFDGEAAVAALKSPNVAPGRRLVQITDPLFPRVTSFGQWRRYLKQEGLVRLLVLYRQRVQAEPFMEAFAKSWGRPVDYLSTRDSISSALVLYKRLRQPGTVVCMAIDMARSRQRKNYLLRAFAGREPRYYSTGAAQLAKETGCPILMCTYRMDENGSYIVEWGQPIRQVVDVAEETNRMLDFLENGVGEYPAHFTDEIGGARRWDADRRQWACPIDGVVERVVS